MITRKKGFTLIEITLVIIISGSILTTVYGIMTLLPRVKSFNDARQNLIQQTNDVMDRFTILFRIIRLITKNILIEKWSVVIKIKKEQLLSGW